MFLWKSGHGAVQTDGVQGPSRNIEHDDFEICHDPERESFSGGS